MEFFREVAEPLFVTGEHEVLRFWSDRRIFATRRTLNAGKPVWSFLDGPITANNPMGVHHAWGRTYKDVFQRFQAMRGHDLRYQNGFDCQGLWVEVEVEKEFKLASKADVQAYGIDRFVRECKKRVLTFAARQTEQSIRLGYWMEWDDPSRLRALAATFDDDRAEISYTTPRGETVTDRAEAITAKLGNPQWGGSYFTFSTENNETIWTFLKKCHNRGKIYRGYDVMPWSGRSGSAYSQMEVADGRRLTVHRSIFLRFPLRGRTNEYLLVWTTTPWTLTCNVAAAVNPALTYVKLRAKRDGAIYYFAKENLEYARLEKEFKEGFGRPEWSWPKGTAKLKNLAQIFKEQGGYDVDGELLGSEMVGWEYDGPFDDLPAQSAPGGLPADKLNPSRTGIGSHRVIDGGRDSKGSPTVVAGEGTGIVHIAPGCGDIDFQIGKVQKLAVIAPLAGNGQFLEGFGVFSGLSATAKETVDLVIEELRNKKLLVAVEEYPHVYPHCWRTGDELVFRLVEEWFINMDWRGEIQDVTRQAQFLPDSIDGQERELEWLTNMRDWMISKKRFWGLALPIWVDEVTGDFEVIGSLDELKSRAVEGWDILEGHSPHRPWIDHVKIRNPKTGNLMQRIPDVGNPWLDAGIVPFSTMGYNTDKPMWERWYPADLVTECFPGQFRNWFYALLSMATMMDNSPPFRVLLGHRLVMDEKGKPMHKSDGTAIWFEEAAEQLGVDTMRWMYLAQNPANDLRFGQRHPDKKITIPTVDGPQTFTLEGNPICEVASKPADEVRRLVLLPLWHSYSFFTNYARLDGFDPRTALVPIGERPQIDRWILSRLQELIQTVVAGLEAFDTPTATRAVTEFLDDLSNWYIRRNRKRFWRSRDSADRDKLAAYQTLYQALVTLTQLLAPMIPFLTERIYRNLVTHWNPEAPESVHLCDYPHPDDGLLNPALNTEMALAQQVVRLGHKLREDAGRRVRQPLAELRMLVNDPENAEAVMRLQDVIEDELNVKILTLVPSLNDVMSYRYRPNPKTLGPKLGGRLGALQKAWNGIDPAIFTPLRQGQSITLTLADGGEIITLAPADVHVEAINEPGWAGGEDRGITLALQTEVTPELAREGAARDFIRQVQQLRKDADLDTKDRIRIDVATPDGIISEALVEWTKHIQSETQADALTIGESASDAAVTLKRDVNVGDATITVSITRADGKSHGV